MLNLCLENVSKDCYEIYNEHKGYLGRYTFVSEFAELAKYKFSDGWSKFPNVPGEKILDLMFDEMVNAFLKQTNDRLHKEYNERNTCHKKFDYIIDFAKKMKYEIDKSRFQVH